MSVYQEVKEKVDNKQWRSIPYRGFGADSPLSTMNEVVSLAFDGVTQNYNRARHCHLYEMYNPILGDYRRRPYYTSLAPSLAMNQRCSWVDEHECFSNRECERGFTEHKAYSPKQGEWLVLKDKNHARRRASAPLHARETRARSEEPVSSSRHYYVPTRSTRFENFIDYWRGRESGVDYAAPFLRYADYTPMEDRRYHRLYWAPDFIDLLPTCRHARQLMLSAY